MGLFRRLCQPFGFAHREPLGDDFTGKRNRVGRGHKGAGVTRCQLTFAQPALDGFRKIEQTQKVGYVAAAFDKASAIFSCVWPNRSINWR